jgi:hypothetical protein
MVGYGQAPLCRPFPRIRHISAPCQQPSDGNILVKFLPMDTTRRNEKLFATCGRPVEKSGKPGEGNAQCATILKLTLHLIIIKADIRCSSCNSHS